MTCAHFFQKEKSFVSFPPLLASALFCFLGTQVLLSMSKIDIAHLLNQNSCDQMGKTFAAAMSELLHDCNCDQLKWFSSSSSVVADVQADYGALYLLSFVAMTIKIELRHSSRTSS